MGRWDWVVRYGVDRGEWLVEEGGGYDGANENGVGKVSWLVRLGECGVILVVEGCSGVMAVLMEELSRVSHCWRPFVSRIGFTLTIQQAGLDFSTAVV